MKKSTGIGVLELSTQSVGREGFICATLIWDNETVVLVDSGFPGQLKLLQESMAKLEIPFEKLDRIIITHQDFDHIGGLPDILKTSDHKIEVISHIEEKPYIEGTKPLLKWNPEQTKKALESLPEERKRAFLEQMANPPIANVDRTVTDGEVLPYCGGITVIHTPGHTMGHISLYHNGTKTLITGDELLIIDGKLSGPNPRFTYDMNLATASLKKLSTYDVETVICYHGGVFRDEPNKRIAELAAG
jgi:glyoxylase-like metal-dependent hydrolase (beta-lactamase superfamily II)